YVGGETQAQTDAAIETGATALPVALSERPMLLCKDEALTQVWKSYRIVKTSDYSKKTLSFSLQTHIFTQQ
ncbi:MAG: hypothetical protein ABMA01_19655, partial [Chthoniobacteraceae bacterium]